MTKDFVRAPKVTDPVQNQQLMDKLDDILKTLEAILLELKIANQE
jgi:hypothetical protein